MNRFFMLILLIFSSSICCAAPVEIDPLDKMPIMENLPSSLRGYSPTEERGIEYRKFLAASVKIGVSNASGSGTIVYYDVEKNLAYVATCGHLWDNGIMSAKEGAAKKMKCKVIAYYHNKEKLKETKSYPADVIFYSHTADQDTALITFKPDWVPEYYPIASSNYVYKKNSIAHSCGCDGGREVAHYSVKIDQVNDNVITKMNSPRPGRSGGGLMDDSGYYIGTCWGTQYIDGSGIGYFTPLSDIHSFWGKQSGYEFLLNRPLKEKFAQTIPIKDHQQKKSYISPDYILIP